MHMCYLIICAKIKLLNIILQLVLFYNQEHYVKTAMLQSLCTEINFLVNKELKFRFILKLLFVKDIDVLMLIVMIFPFRYLYHTITM